MGRRTTDSSKQTLWPTEGEQTELEEYMNRRLASAHSAEPPAELAWVADALEASWPAILAEADATR
jgi:hypothetical protein